MPTKITITVPINQPGPAYVEYLKQFPSTSGGAAKYKRIAKYLVRPGDDARQFHPTLILSSTLKVRVKSEAQVVVTLPTGAGQNNGAAQLYDNNETNQPIYQENQVAPAANGGPTVLTPGGNGTWVVNAWQYLEITGT